ncbi:tetratricopeptide repeat protein [Daejeonella sp. H1SJ63]|uniref:tetratricopeptide repeat protein n=1 Tax=Daejeonella sp. H1SJ63 TaxID=3034145 RepID=UPI0023EAFE06|nr:tetratricopeptide repeat protein [Daejeonella sp. H1SJ63]
MRILLFIAILLLSLKSFAQNAGSDNLLILELLQNQRYDEASEYLKRIYPEPISDKKILSRFGYSLRMAGKLTEAEKYYQRILDQDPGEISSLFSMAGISQRKGNFLKAKDYYKQILAIDSTNFSVYKQLSDMIESSEGLLFATNYLQKANNLNPADGDIAYSYSKVLKDLKQYDSAAKVLDEAIRVDSTNLVLLRGKAELAYAMKSYDKAAEYLSKTISESISPNTAGYYAQVGDVLEKNKLIRQLLEAYQKSLFFDNKPLTLYTIASIYDQKLKQFKSALTYYRRYVNSEPPSDQKAYIEYSKFRIAELSR